MTAIVFDVLVPDDQSQKVLEMFETAMGKLTDSGRVAGAEVTMDANPAVSEAVVEQLRQVYRDEHEERDLEFASVYRYRIVPQELQGSYNQLTMVLSRLLTPHAELPADHVLLENEKAHERASIFPWTVEIQR